MTAKTQLATAVAILTAGVTVAAAGGQIGTGAAAACKIPQGASGSDSIRPTSRPGSTTPTGR